MSGNPMRSVRRAGLQRPELKALAVALTLVASLLVINAGAMAAPCGGQNQRACCVCEGLPACQVGLVQQAGCSGACDCGGDIACSVFDSSGTCVDNGCGGAGQRACCVGQNGYGAAGAGCDPGTREVFAPACGQPGTPGCGGCSISWCASITPCGGTGQRACCVGEGAACGPGLTEQGNCVAELGLQQCGGCSVGVCRPSNCGAAGQSACDAFTRPGQPCNAGLREVFVPACGTAGAPACAGVATTWCATITPCGGEGERACCALADGGSACDAGLLEKGNCANELGLLNCGGCSVGVCRAKDCGGAGQRACCANEQLELGQGPCDAGLLEKGSCTGILGAGACGGCSIGVCVATTECGGLDQRACCFLEDTSIGACEEGLVEGGSCEDELGTANCFCGGASLVRSEGVCRQPECGGEGERACCVLERVPSCDPGLIEDLTPGCATELGVEGCACGFGPGQALGVCRALKGMGETGCDPLFDPCASDLVCRAVGAAPGETMCLPPEGDELFSEQLCAAFYVPALHQAAIATELTTTFSTSATLSAAASGSVEVGVAYSGVDKCYGCFLTTCAGINFDVSVEVAACTGQGFDGLFDSVAGNSCTLSVSAEIPFTEIGVSVGTSHPGSEPLPLPEDCLEEPNGASQCLSIGIGLNPLPVGGGAMLCHTVTNLVGCYDDSVSGDGDLVLTPDEPPTCLEGLTLGVCPGTTSIPLMPLAFDPDGDPLSYAWTTTCDAHFDDSTAAAPALLFDTVPSCTGLDCSVTLTATGAVQDGGSTTPVQVMCSASITNDTTAPRFTTFPDDVTFHCTTPPSSDYAGTPAATDTCGETGVVISQSSVETPGGCPGRTITRTWSAQDACGNVRTRDQVITFDNLVNPTAFTWTGVLGAAWDASNGSINNWNQGLALPNWFDTVTFPASAGGSVLLNGDRAVASVTFTGGGYTFVPGIAGSDLLIDSGDITSLAGTQVFGVNVGLGGGADWNVTGTLDFSNPLLAAGSITKAGPGAVILRAGSSIPGPVVINAGSLRVENTTGSATGIGAVSVNAGGALGGSGSVSGTVTVNSGGRIAPGAEGLAAIADLAVGGLTLQSGSTVHMQMAGAATPGVSFDQLQAGGAVTIVGGTLDIDYAAGFTAVPGQTFALIEGVTLTGEFTSVSFPDDQAWYLDYDAAETTVTAGICNDPVATNVARGWHHCTVQDALNRAANGDVIQLAAGVIPEDGIVFPGGINLTLRGAGRGLTIIDGGGGADTQPILTLNGSGQTAATVISDLTLRNGISTYPEGPGGVYLFSTSPTFRNVDFENNGGPGLGGAAHLVLRGSAAPSLDRCRFLGGHSAYESIGGSAGTSLTMLQCLVAGSTTNRLLRLDGPSNRLINCTLAAAGTASGVALNTVGGVIQATNCVIAGSQSASSGGAFDRSRCLYVGAAGDNINAAPAFVDAAGGDYRLLSGSPGVDAADHAAFEALSSAVADLRGASRLVDDCAAPDTGSGAVTYLDLGAYESIAVPLTNLTTGVVHGTVQEALLAAADGDIIEIAPGTICEDGIIFPAGLDVDLRGAGRGLTVIDGGGGGDTQPILNFPNTGQTPATIISDLTLRNGVNTSAEGPGGVRVLSASPTFRLVDFENNAGPGVGGSAHVTLRGSAAPRFDRCRFVDGHSAYESIGGSGSTSLTMLQCLVADSTTNLLLRLDGAANTLVNCTFSSAGTASGVALASGDGTVHATNCVIAGSQYTFGSALIQTSRCLYTGAAGNNVDGQPIFVHAAGGDYRLASGSPGMDASDYDVYSAAGGGAADLNGDMRTIDACASNTGSGAFDFQDIGAYETFEPAIRNVSRDTLHSTIQEALLAAEPDDVIQLAACTFWEDGIVFPGGINLTLRGAGRGLTIIDGGGGADTQPILTLNGSGQTAATVISDLTLRNGISTYPEGPGGVYLFSTSPTFRNVDFENNGGPGLGGAAHLVLRGSAAPSLDRCRFLGGHSAYESIGGSAGTSLTMLQCLVAGSTTNLLIRLDGAPNSLTNATLDAAGTSGGGTALFTVGGAIHAQNCILSGSLFTAEGGTILTSRCLYPGASGDNLAGSATFIDAIGGDYRLGPGSLGIDAADYDAYLLAGGISTDLAGEPRTFDDHGVTNSGAGSPSYLDMGAHERQSSSSAGACCVDDTCTDGVEPDSCGGFVCEVAEHLPESFNGCYGDLDGNGVVNAGDRGFVSANVGQIEFNFICLYDLDGNGVINAADRGFVSANIGLCTPLPNYMNGSGLNAAGTGPDTRFGATTFMGAGTTCASVTCP